MKNTFKALLKSLAYEIMTFMEKTQMSEKTMSGLLNISIEDFQLILKAEFDLKLSELVEISFKIGKNPRVLFTKEDISQS